MDASLLQYPQGAIVMYNCPFEKKVAKAHGVLPSHPVMILDKNLAGATYSFNVMCITTKMDEYFGFKIFMNTLDPKFRRMSIICPERIYQVRRTDLGEILGFAPPALVEKCKKAFLYQIGATDEIPEYFRENEMAMQYLEVGEPNIPKSSSYYKTMAGGTVEGLGVATYTPPVACDKNGIMLAKSNRVEIDYVERDLPESCIPHKDTSDFVTTQTPTLEIKEPEDIPEPDPEPTPPMSIDIETHQRELSTDMMDRIATRRVEPVQCDKSMARLMESMSGDSLYAIWMERVSSYRLHRKGILKSYYTAEKFLQFVRYRIQVSKENLINGIKDGTIELKYLTDGFYIPFRCLSLEELNKLHIGITLYEAYCKAFEIPFENTFVGESVALARKVG